MQRMLGRGQRLARRLLGGGPAQHTAHRQLPPQATEVARQRLGGAGGAGAHGSGSTSDAARYLVVYDLGDGQVQAVEETASGQPVRQGLPQLSGGALRHQFFDVFFPKGYPGSVGKSFAAYCQWNFVQTTLGTVQGVLATQALLFAIGLGSGSVPLAAAINWVLKDGLGQFGGVLYATLYGQRFDVDPKRQRWLATVALQASTFLEAITPLVPGLFLPLASLSNVGKNISWLASSATRAQIHASYALTNNLGDLTGKITSQSIAASLVGTAIGISLSHWTGASSLHVLAALVPLGGLVLYANYMSNAVAAIRTLNRQRGELLVASVLRDLDLDPYLRSEAAGNVPTLADTKLFVPEPEDIASQERFVQEPLEPFRIPLLADATLEAVVADIHRHQPGGSKRSKADILQGLMANQGFLEGSERYLLAAYSSPSGTVIPMHHKVAIFFLSEATVEDQLKGFVHACCVRRALQQHSRTADVDAVVSGCHRLTTDLLPGLQAGLKSANWLLDTMPFADSNATVWKPKATTPTPPV